MKKFMAAILCIALAFSVMSIGVFADEVVVEEATSDVYTIDATAGVVSKVAPFTTVATFEGNFKTGNVQVVNVDGSLMADDAYATENVYANINGVLYRIDVAYPYYPIQKDGRVLADGRNLYNQTDVTKLNGSSMTNTGFNYVEVYDKFGYGKDVVSAKIEAGDTVTATKQTENGMPIYVLENDSPQFAYLRSDKTDSKYNPTQMRTDTKDKFSVVTTEFEADKLGNISLFTNTPYRKSGSIADFDAPIDQVLVSTSLRYAPVSVHFLESGDVKVGGTYTGQNAVDRAPAQETGFKWIPGKKYTVSIMLKYTDNSSYAYIYGIYINGEKVFPNSSTVTAQGVGVSSGTASLSARTDTSTKFGGGISSVMIGTAPKTEGDKLTVKVSDVKVYTVASQTAYNPAMDADITLVSADEYITIDNKAATVTSTLGAVTADRFTMPGYKVAVRGNVLTVVSNDGLTAKKYAVTHGTGMQAGFYNADTDAEIDRLAGVTNVGFTAFIDKAASSEFAGKTARIFLVVYKNDELAGVIKADGEIYAGEMTKYTAEYDISSIETVAGDEISVRAFVWNSTTLAPLTESFDIQ